MIKTKTKSKFMNTLKKIFFTLLALVMITSSLPAWSGSVEGTPSKHSTKALKKYMARFGSYIAGINIARYQDEKPDYEMIDTSVNEMLKSLNDMQKYDKDGLYKNYTSQLEKQLVSIKTKTAAHDQNIYKAFDGLMDTCFGCHTAHRPANFLEPTKE